MFFCLFVLFCFSLLKGRGTNLLRVFILASGFGLEESARTSDFLIGGVEIH